MRRALLVFEIFGLALFSTALIVSFGAEDWVLENSKEAIQKQIRPKADLAVDLAEEGLRSKLATRYLAEDQIGASLAEVQLYRNDPAGYIRSITGFGYAPKVSDDSGPSAVLGLAAKFVDWKARVRQHFTQTFTRLMTDLRLFLASTAIAFGIAAFLVSRNEKPARRHLIASAILALATFYSALAYIDQNWFFTILLNNYMGWGYPLGIGLMFGWLLFEYYSRKNDDSARQGASSQLTSAWRLVPTSAQTPPF